MNAHTTRPTPADDQRVDQVGPLTAAGPGADEGGAARDEADVAEVEEAVGGRGEGRDAVGGALHELVEDGVAQGERAGARGHEVPGVPGPVAAPHASAHEDGGHRCQLDAEVPVERGGRVDQEERGADGGQVQEQVHSPEASHTPAVGCL